MKPLICTLLFVIASIFSTACTSDIDASQVAPEPQPSSRSQQQGSLSGNESSKCNPTLDQVLEKARSFVSHNKAIITDQSAGESMSVAERIAVGFQQDPPRMLVVHDGITFVWGWQEGQPERQSLLILDGSCNPRMVGAADNIPLIYSRRSETAVTSLSEFKAILDARATYMAGPVFYLYADDQRSIDQFYPLARRWLEAALMGFNTRCSVPMQASSCRVAALIQIPIVLQTRDCDQPDGAQLSCRLKTPSSVPITEPKIDAFKQ